jgi:hypothetical protein
MLRRIICAFRGHDAWPSYPVNHPDLLSCRCTRCGFRWVMARTSGL